LTIERGIAICTPFQSAENLRVAASIIFEDFRRHKLKEASGFLPLLKALYQAVISKFTNELHKFLHLLCKNNNDVYDRIKDLGLHTDPTTSALIKDISSASTT
jgi:hypothetical protein